MAVTSRDTCSAQDLDAHLTEEERQSGNRRIYVTKRSTNAKKEFKTYTYQQDKEGKWLNKPIDANNHIIDAVRYGVLERYRKYQRGTRIIDDSILY